MISLVAVQGCSFLTVEPGETGQCMPVLSNGAFKNLSIIVKPQQDPSLYTVTVYHDGEIAETHTYNTPGTRTVAEMQMENFIFPLNNGINTVRAFVGSRLFSGIPIVVAIENLDATIANYEIYACYEMYENVNVHVANQL